MIRGYVSSDEDDYDDYDFGYTEASVKQTEEPASLPEVQIPENKEILYSALKESEKIELFFRNVECGNVTVLEELISEGISVDCLNEQQWTPLIKACGTGNLHVVQFLLESGANPNVHRELLTPLMTCCSYTLDNEIIKLDCVRLLLDYGAEVNAKDKYHTTALMYATESGYADIVTRLLEVPGIDVNIQDKEGWTALFYAVKNNNENLIEKLLTAGSDLNLRDRLERTVVQIALNKDLMDVAKLLGYVEKQSNEPVKIKTLRTKYLNKLPDSKGQGGFNSDAKKMLKYFKQCNIKPISFSDLLNATDKDLYNIGVILRPDREKILSKGIHAFHLCPWKKESLPKLTPGVPISMEDVAAIAGALAKHLTIANASLRYLDTRITLRQNKEELTDLAVQKEMILCLLNIYQSAEKLKTVLPKIIKHIKKIKNEEPADFIHPHKTERKSKKLKIFQFFLFAVGAAFACRRLLL